MSVAVSYPDHQLISPPPTFKGQAPHDQPWAALRSEKTPPAMGQQATTLHLFSLCADYSK